jgi:hypothetical protein
MIISAGVVIGIEREREKKMSALFHFYFISRLFDGEEVDV